MRKVFRPQTGHFAASTSRKLVTSSAPFLYDFPLQVRFSGLYFVEAMFSFGEPRGG